VRRLIRRPFAAVAVAVAVGLAVATPVGAQAPAGTIRLVSQTAWVTQGAEFALRLLATTRTPSDLEIAVTVYPAVGSRSAFNETLDDKVQGSAVSVKSDRVSDLAVDPDGAVTIKLPIQDPVQPRDPFRIRLRGAGVYPVVVELRGVGGGARVDRFTTHMVNLPEAITGPKLATALTLPLAAPPALQADGTRRVPASWSTALRALVGAVETYGDVPITLLPQPETVQALALSERDEDRTAAGALNQAVGGRLLLAAPYVRLTEPAYTGLESEEAAQRRHGVDVLTPIIGRAPDQATAVVDDGLDDGTANRLTDAQVQRVIVRERALKPLALRTTLTQPFQLRGRSGRRLPAAAADDGLAAHFTGKATGALAGHQLLADLAVLYFDSPGLARGVAVLPPAGWKPAADFIAPVLDGLRSSPILLPVDAAGLFAAVPVATGAGRTPLLRDAAVATAGTTTLPLTELRRARRELSTLQDLTLGDNPVVAGIEERILAGQSGDLRPRQRTDYMTKADRAVRQQLEAIRVPPNQSITLTARRGEIPVTILRDVAYPVRVVVQLTSDKLQFPQGDTAQLDLTRRNTTTRFTVQARTSGTFPLQVTLRSPDGKVVLSTGRFTIRSRAASGVGVILSVSAICFLILWWGRHIFVARRARNSASASAGAGPPPAPAIS
jgi:hypothetical protein